jgi:hypothetical protein
MKDADLDLTNCIKIMHCEKRSWDVKSGITYGDQEGNYCLLDFKQMKVTEVEVRIYYQQILKLRIKHLERKSDLIPNSSSEHKTPNWISLPTTTALG